KAYLSFPTPIGYNAGIGTTIVLTTGGMYSIEKMVFGTHESETLRQFDTCVHAGNAAADVVCADGRDECSQSAGGVAVYAGQISPSGVGFDIACGNKAVKTNLLHHDIKHHISTIMDDIKRKIPFGVGKSSGKNKDHAVFEDPEWDVFKEIGTHEH